MSPVRYELGFYIPEDGILHSHRGVNLRSYTLTLHEYSYNDNSDCWPLRMPHSVEFVTSSSLLFVRCDLSKFPAL
jgi:hypothetical protein